MTIIQKGELMGDLISRQAAIAEIMEDLEDRSLHDDPATPEDFAEGYDEGIRNAAAIVLQMPPAQPGWIPTSEKLPKKDGDYLVTTHSGQIARYIFIGGSSEEYWRRCATAWMPLPNPWEGGQDG